MASDHSTMTFGETDKVIQHVGNKACHGSKGENGEGSNRPELEAADEFRWDSCGEEDPVVFTKLTDKLNKILFSETEVL